MVFLTAISGAVLTYFLIFAVLRAALLKRITIEERVKETMEMGEKPLFPQKPESSFRDRMVKPLITSLIEFFAVIIPRNPAVLERLSQQLKQAEIYVSAQNYRASVLLFTICCMLVTFFYSRLLGQPLQMAIIYSAVGLYAGIVLSRFQLKSKIKKRSDEIYHQLPEMMDLLSVSVSAGLGFDQALAYVVKKSQGALFRELDLVQREVTLGRPRKEALIEFAKRCDSQEIQTFVSAVNQADEMGSSMQNLLQVQAETIRETHKQGVEEKAQKLTVKMLLPLVFFIFPVLFLVLLGPAVISIAGMFGGM